MNGHWTGQALTTTEVHFTGSRPTLYVARPSTHRTETETVASSVSLPDGKPVTALSLPS